MKAFQWRFARIVEDFIEDNPNNAKNLAREFKVGLATVYGWASTKYFPHPNLAEQVINWIQE